MDESAKLWLRAVIMSAEAWEIISVKMIVVFMNFIAVKLLKLYLLHRSCILLLTQNSECMNVCICFEGDLWC